jgi:hypothetical protein
MHVQRQTIADASLRRMIGRIVRERDAEKLSQRERIAAPPGNAPLRADPLEVADQQHAKVHARRHRRPALPLRIIRLAQCLDMPIKAALAQERVELVTKHMPRRPRQLVVHHEQILLLLRLTLAHRHPTSPPMAEKNPLGIG